MNAHESAIALIAKCDEMRSAIDVVDQDTPLAVRDYYSLISLLMVARDDATKQIAIGDKDTYYIARALRFYNVAESYAGDVIATD